MSSSSTASSATSTASVPANRATAPVGGAITSTLPSKVAITVNEIITDESIKRVNSAGVTVCKQYRRGRYLGKGGFAQCFELTSLDSGKVYAGKIIPKASIQKPSAKKKLIAEISIHRKIHHANVVKFERFFEDSQNVYIVLELCSNQTLLELVKRRVRLTETETQFYMWQLTNTISHLHSQNIIHRDLKLGNLFLNADLDIRLGDFGLATQLEHADERKRTICGTPNYIAPEILDGNSQGKNGHSFEVDTWAMGIIMFTMLVGQPPFETSSVKTTYKRIRDGIYEFPKDIAISTPAKSLIQRILSSNPEERPSLQEMINDPFFTQSTFPQKLPISCLKTPLVWKHQWHVNQQQQQQQSNISHNSSAASIALLTSSTPTSAAAAFTSTTITTTPAPTPSSTTVSIVGTDLLEGQENTNARPANIAAARSTSTTTTADISSSMAAMKLTGSSQSQTPQPTLVKKAATPPKVVSPTIAKPIATMTRAATMTGAATAGAAAPLTRTTSATTTIESAGSAQLRAARTAAASAAATTSSSHVTPSPFQPLGTPASQPIAPSSAAPTVSSSSSSSSAALSRATNAPVSGPITSTLPSKVAITVDEIITDASVTRVNSAGVTVCKQYRRGRYLGKGGFAQCFELTSLDSGKVYAGKIIPKASIQKPSAKKKLIAEISIHRKIHHANVVKFERFFEDSQNVYILLELCSNQTLLELVKRRVRLTETETQFYMWQLTNTIAHLHSQNIIHRDLKLGNLFLNADLDIRLGDFGLATQLEHADERKRTICGTPNYIAPEILDGNSQGKNGHSFEVDTWAMGIIMFTMLVGQPPFETSSVKTTYKRIRDGIYEFPKDIAISTPAKSLIQRILSSNPEERPSLQEMINDPFFTQSTFPQKLPISCLKTPLVWKHQWHVNQQQQQQPQPSSATAASTSVSSTPISASAAVSATSTPIPTPAPASTPVSIVGTELLEGQENTNAKPAAVTTRSSVLVSKAVPQSTATTTASRMSSRLTSKLTSSSSALTKSSAPPTVLSPTRRTTTSTMKTTTASSSSSIHVTRPTATSSSTTAAPKRLSSVRPI